MQGDLRVLASFPTPVEADVLRMQLEAAGIRSVLDNEGVVGLNWMLGNAVGGVKVLVSEQDFEAARQVMADEAAAAQDRPSHDWTCPACGKAVEGDFDLCWSCGTNREGERDVGFAAEIESADDEPADADLPTEKSGESAGGDSAVAAYWEAECEAANPFRSPLPPEDAPAKEENEDDADTEEADAVAYRAWRSSVIGLVYCPPFLHLYSICLLLPLAFSECALSPKARRRCVAAWAINLAVSAVFGLAFAWIANGSR